jgi:hypothetical protein
MRPVDGQQKNSVSCLPPDPGLNRLHGHCTPV